MSDRNTRRIIVIAALVITVAAVSVGLFALTRATLSPLPSMAPSPGGPQTTTGASPSPAFEPTDPSGSPESGLPRGEALAGKGGSKTGPAGLPVGYGHDEAGAVNAATNYLIWMNSLRIADKDVADGMAAATAADPKTETALVESFDLLRSGMEELTRNQPEPARGAYAVASYTAGRALVYVWLPEVTTHVDGQTDHLWAIDAVQLVWSNGDWKLDAALITKSGAAAVDPTDPAGNPTGAEKQSILRQAPTEPDEITDTADQSWFEYANAPH